VELTNLFWRDPDLQEFIALLDTNDASIANFIDVPSVSVDIKLWPVDAAIPISLTVELTYHAGRDDDERHGSRVAEWRYLS
jgi:hypothetical protein